MTAPSRLVRFAALALLAIVLSGCATLLVKSYVPTGTDFNRYGTYSWAPADVLSTGDARLDNNTIFQERLQKDVEQHLQAKGFEKMAGGRGDLLVHYHVSISQQVDLNGTDRRAGDCEDCRPFIFDAGTLVVDLVDSRTNLLVWRGWAEDSVDGVIDDQRRMEQKIDNAVSRLMAKLPRPL